MQQAVVKSRVEQGSALARLTGMATAPDRFDFPYADLRDVQVQALNEAFQDRKDRLKVVGLRAKEAGLTEVRDLSDAVQLLLPHTAYKSYPENWLREGRWAMMTKWLGTISPHPIKPIDLTKLQGIDDWINVLDAVGHYIACSSGTTGKSAMLIASQADMEWSKIDTVNMYSWGSGVQPLQDRMMVCCAPIAKTPKATTIWGAQYKAFANPAWKWFDYPVPPITVGSLTKMVVLRKAIADGTALPNDIAEFDRATKERQDTVDAAVGITADYIIANREKKLFLTGLWNGHYHVAKAVRERGYSAKDFHPDNCIYVGGGLKRALLPSDYQQFVHETYNISADKHFQNYSIQELNSGMPRCREGGRYHVPPWMVPMILNRDGDVLESHTCKGEFEGRAAFFDLSLDGRWGGVITGDKIQLDFSPCKCGARSPSITDNVARFADLEGDDKIGCAGTVDAYVRGVS